MGRQAEVAQVVRTLDRARSVTLTGVGGVGKTRLALRVARVLQPSFPDGVWFVELSSLREPELLGNAVCSVLRVAQRVGRTQIEVLAEFLEPRRALLVLDTCEHLADECAALVDTLLEAAPGLRVVATSRRVLGIDGEWCIQVEPLPVEEPAKEPAERPSGVTGKAAAGGGAVALFVDRAGTLVPGFAATPEVAVICRRLDGIPLAIELAAVRLRTLSVEQIMRRIDDRFGLLLGGDPAGQPRHRTLRTAIGWSHELCEPLERLLWARLAVFAGDFDLEAARAVCADPGSGAGLRRDQVESLLYALVDKSIVRRDDTGEGVRFHMLDTLRDYGAEWLRELGQEERTRRRHRDHYLDLARRFDAEWFGADQVAWYVRMRRELPNLRSALEFCLGDAQAEHPVGLDLAGRLTYFWIGCGFVAEGRHYLGRALALCHAPGANRSRALWACAWLADFQGDLEEANDLATECMFQAFSGGHRAAAGWGTICCANTGLHWGYLNEVLPMYERARRAHEQGGDPGAGVAYALLGEAYVLRRLGRHEQALACLRRQRRLCDAYGDIWLRSSGDLVRTLIEIDRGDMRTADRYAHASLRAKRVLHDSFGMAAAVKGLAGTAAGLGDMERAARLLGIGDLVERSFGVRLGLPHPNGAGEQAEARARKALGERRFRDAVTRGRELELESALSYALTGGEDAEGAA
ncbi:ATPase [Sphaerisporangium sp. NPDC051011]|uniref:ATP-binding protein n=1 Tax=Sphaerisporangium sp. NPDC051011 TaxID=3155792 RepID=UPI0033E7E3A5